MFSHDLWISSRIPEPSSTCHYSIDLGILVWALAWTEQEKHQSHPRTYRNPHKLTGLHLASLRIRDKWYLRSNSLFDHSMFPISSHGAYIARLNNHLTLLESFANLHNLPDFAYLKPFRILTRPSITLASQLRIRFLYLLHLQYKLISFRLC